MPVSPVGQARTTSGRCAPGTVRSAASGQQTWTVTPTPTPSPGQPWRWSDEEALGPGDWVSIYESTPVEPPTDRADRRPPGARHTGHGAHHPARPRPRLGRGRRTGDAARHARHRAGAGGLPSRALGGPVRHPAGAGRRLLRPRHAPRTRGTPGGPGPPVGGAERSRCHWSRTTAGSRRSSPLRTASSHWPPDGTSLQLARRRRRARPSPRTATGTSRCAPRPRPGRRSGR